jgi:hypothetical protein
MGGYKKSIYINTERNNKESRLPFGLKILLDCSSNGFETTFSTKDSPDSVRYCTMNKRVNRLSPPGEKIYNKKEMISDPHITEKDTYNQVEFCSTLCI